MCIVVGKAMRRGEVTLNGCRQEKNAEIKVGKGCEVSVLHGLS